MERNKTFRALVWQDMAGKYFPDGKYADISCNHVPDGVWGINMVGEIVPTITATVPVTETGTGYQKDELGIRAGHIYSNPAEFSDPGFKAVVRVKDMQNQNTYYVDQTSYNATVDTCNECCTE